MIQSINRSARGSCGGERKETMQGKRFSMLSALLTVLILLTVWCVPAAVAETVSADSANEEGADDPSSSYLYGGIACLKDHYYFFSEAEDRVLFEKPVSGGASVGLGTISSEQLMGDDGIGYHVSTCFLIVWRDQLYLLSPYTQKWYSLLNEQGELEMKEQSVRLDLEVMMEKDGDYSYPMSTNARFVMGDWLYFVGTTYSGGTNETCFGRVSLTGEASQMFEVENVINACVYEDGKLALFLCDMSALYTGEASPSDMTATLAIFDPESGTLGTEWPVTSDNQMGVYNLRGFCSDGDKVYYQNGSRIMGIDPKTGEIKIAAYTGAGMYGGGGTTALCENGYYVTDGNSGLSAYLLNSPSLEKGALRIFGETGSEAHQKFVKAHPEISVEAAGDYASDLETLTQAMVSDTNTYDVLFLSLSYMPVDRLLQKGYCADLTGDEALMDVARSMYPQFGEILMKDGKLYGLPVDANAYTYSVNMDAWEALGLTEDDLPRTLLDLMDFTANWAFDYGDEYSEYYLFDWVNQSGFFSMILSEYLTYIQKKEGKIVFNTPEFEELLRAFEDINFKELEQLHDQNEAMDMEKIIFQSYTTVLPLSNFQYLDENYRPLYLSVAEGEEPSLSVTTTVMIINPKTTRMEEARTYMEYYVTHLPKDEGAITFFQGTPEPVESPYYARQKKQTEKEIANAKERLEKASEENKASIRDEISSLEEDLKYQEQNRYSISAERIQYYQQTMLPMLYVERQNVLYSGNQTAMTEISTLINQYIEGAIPRDRLIRELEGRIRLMQLEDEI